MIRRLTAQDIPRANELFSIAFEQPPAGPAEPDDGRTHRWAAFTDDTDEMMSTLTVTDFTVRFDGNACKMGGVGGVATLPQYRRRGGIRGCFETMLPELYAGGYDFSYLYPFSTGYYRKFGYECCVQKYFATVNPGLLAPPKTDGTLRMAERENAMKDAIRAIDAVWEQRYNMAILHQTEDYDWTENQEPAVKQKFTYVYFSAEGTPKAYTTFAGKEQDGKRSLVCRHFFFTDKEGFAGLMNLFKSFASDHQSVQFALPADPAMQYLMPEWSLGAASWSIQPAGMVRAVNVKRVLEKAAYRGEGSVVLAIRDPQIAENDRRFAVRFAGGRAVSVEKTQETPDAVFSIPAFSALICGVCDFADAAKWMDGIQICRPSDALSQVFYRKPMMIADFF